MRRTLSHAVLCALALLVASCVDSRVNSNNSDPEAAILEPAPDFVALLGESVTFRGTVDDGPTATDDLEVSWSSSLDTVLFEETPDSDGETTFTTDALSLGEHTITLRVLDPQGASGTDAITITIEEPEIENTTPTCAITEPEDDAELDADDTVVFEGTADDGETAANELTATWSSSEDGELGVVSPSSSGAIALPVNDLSTGTHVITLDVSDGELNCSEFIVVEVIPDNFPPSIGSPAVTPDPLYTNDIAQCVAPTPTDPEGDSIYVALRWLVDGNDVGVTIDTLAGAQFSKGQSVVCEVTPSDATGSGASMTSPTLLVSDTPPTAPGVGIAPVAPVEGIDDLVCSVTTPSADLDGEIVTYAVSWALNGVTWSGATSTTTLPGDTIAAADAAGATMVFTGERH
ncbi:MAG: hypothetical protein KDA24_28275, partial [Deltaproteobacteria bacterium]|nr:hypothetical protein [Deltaproteobacteria bacterium]